MNLPIVLVLAAAVLHTVVRSEVWRRKATAFQGAITPVLAYLQNVMLRTRSCAGGRQLLVRFLCPANGQVRALGAGELCCPTTKRQTIVPGHNTVAVLHDVSPWLGAIRGVPLCPPSLPRPPSQDGVRSRPLHAWQRDGVLPVSRQAMTGRWSSDGGKRNHRNWLSKLPLSRLGGC